LNRQRLAQVQALRANSAYNETKEGLEGRRREIEEINRHFNQMIETVMDPDKHERQMRKIKNDPLLSAGVRGLDRLRWNMHEGIDVFARGQPDG